MRSKYLPALILLAASTGLPKAECGCSGNPGALTSDASGPCLTYAAPSGAGNNITYRFNRAYACGQYATGEYFVVAEGGSAMIQDLSPPLGGGRHGWAVNPTGAGSQPFDSRIVDYRATPLTLPYPAKAGESVIKYVSDHPASTSCNQGGANDTKSCGRFAAVLTVVGAPPANPARTFRPPFVGTYKPELSTDALQTGLLGRLPAACCSDRLSRQTAERWTRHFRMDYTSSSVWCDLVTPDDATLPWSTDMWLVDIHLTQWLNMADVCGTPPCTPQQDSDAKRAVLIGWVQHGIDVWAASKLGTSFWRGGGGNGGGKLFAYVFAAAVLNAPELRADLAVIQAGRFFESGSFYRGKHGKALWGQPTGSEREYWTELANPPGASSKTVRDPYGLIDGGRQPGSDYQDNTSKPAQYTGLLLRLMPPLRQQWPVNGDVMMEYADRWADHGTLTVPDSCAPPVGAYGVDYGSNGKGGCIPDRTAPFGRVPDRNGDNRNGGNRKSSFGEQFWAAFRSCSETCACPGQVCAGTAIRMRPRQSAASLSRRPRGGTLLYDGRGRLQLVDPGIPGIFFPGYR